MRGKRINYLFNPTPGILSFLHRPWNDVTLTSTISVTFSIAWSDQPILLNTTLSYMQNHQVIIQNVRLALLPAKSYECATFMTWKVTGLPRSWGWLYRGSIFSCRESILFCAIPTRSANIWFCMHGWNPSVSQETPDIRYFLERNSENCGVLANSLLQFFHCISFACIHARIILFVRSWRRPCSSWSRFPVDLVFQLISRSSWLTKKKGSWCIDGADCSVWVFRMCLFLGAAKPVRLPFFSVFFIWWNREEKRHRLPRLINSAPWFWKWPRTSQCKIGCGRFALVTFKHFEEMEMDLSTCEQNCVTGKNRDFLLGFIEPSPILVSVDSYDVSDVLSYKFSKSGMLLSSITFQLEWYVRIFLTYSFNGTVLIIDK